MDLEQTIMSLAGGEAPAGRVTLKVKNYKK